MDVTLRNQLVAEAKFFRAMMYFDLIRMFGDVPLREHNVEVQRKMQLAGPPKRQFMN